MSLSATEKHEKWSTVEVRFEKFYISKFFEPDHRCHARQSIIFRKQTRSFDACSTLRCALPSPIMVTVLVSNFGMRCTGINLLELLSFNAKGLLTEAFSTMRRNRVGHSYGCLLGPGACVSHCKALLSYS